MNYYINIGSNLGDRRMNLSRAISAIENRFGWFELSHSVESEPWGFESPHKFMNIGMAFISDEKPEDVLKILQEIEHKLSPEPHRHPDGSYADRLVDIDMIAAEVYDPQTGASSLVKMDTPELTLPHAHLDDRPFFLDPFRELLEIMHRNSEQ